MTHDGNYQPDADVAESGVAAEELKQAVERIEQLDGEIEALNDDKRDVYAELKARGFDTKVVKHIIKLRRQDHEERVQFEAILEIYLDALGMS